MPAASVTIRGPVESDAELLTRLQKVSFPWAVEPDPVATMRGYIRSLNSGTSQARTALVVAVRGGRFVGYALGQPFTPWVGGQDLLSPDTPVAVVPQVAVVPSARGSGVGSALLAGLQDPLAAEGFSLIAHIRPDLARWYGNCGWATAPAGIGLAWIEPPSVLNARFLPAEAPPEAVATHTAVLHQPPMNQHGYTALAFRGVDGPKRVLAATAYEATGVKDGRRAAKALIESLNGNSQALSRIPRHSALMLHLASLSDAEAAVWAAEHQ